MLPLPPHPEHNLTSRLVLVAFISGAIGVILHTTLMRTLGVDAERHLPIPLILAAGVLMGAGCAALSEMMRQTKITVAQAWTLGGRHMYRSFGWAALTPIVFIGSWPMPAVAMVAGGIIGGGALTLGFGILTTTAFAALMRVPVGYSVQRFGTNPNHWVADTIVLLGIWGAVLLLGAPVLGDLVVL